MDFFRILLYRRLEFKAKSICSILILLNLYLCCAGLYYQTMSEDYHQMYRGTTLGNTLQESLDEMLDHKLIQPQIAMKVCL